MSAPVDVGDRPAPAPSFLRRLAGDVGYYVPAQALSALLNLAAIATFTRLLDRIEYGGYALVLSGAVMVQQLGFAWLQQSALRFWHGKSHGSRAELDGFLSSLLALCAISTLAVVAAWPLLAPLLLPDLPWALRLLGLPLALAQSAVMLVLARSRAFRSLAAYFCYSVLSPAASLALGVVLIALFGPRAAALLGALIGASTMIVLVELLRQRRAYLPARCRLDRTGILELARYGVPILLGTAGGVVLGMSDRFLISHFHGVGVAGVYALAYALAFRIDTLTMFMSAAAFPLLIHDYEAGRRDQVAFELSRLIALFSAAFAPACTGVALIAGPLVTLLLGPEFHDASSYIVPLMPGVFAAGIHHYLSRPLMLAAKTQPQLYLTLAGAVLNVSLNLVLLPRHGAMAAAWTSSACLILVSVGTYLWSLRYLPYRQDWRGLTKIAAATALMALAVSVSGRSAAPHWALLVKIAVGMGVYGAAALVLDVPGARRTVRRILRRRAAVG